MHYIIGIDEAGRGAWAGPVVAGGWMADFSRAVGLLSSLDGLTDSKILSSKKREILFAEIEKMRSRGECFTALGIRRASDIDTLGIREANRRCMDDVIRTLLSHTQKEDVIEIFIDGCDNYRFDIDGIEIGYDFRRLSIEKAIATQMTGQERIKIFYRIGGDKSIPAISASSIIAKVSRDHIMCDFSVEYRDHAFSLHKGYGTKKHLDALLHYGITSIHRKSYAPVKRLISEHS